MSDSQNTELPTLTRSAALSPVASEPTPDPIVWFPLEPIAGLVEKARGVLRAFEEQPDLKSRFGDQCQTGIPLDIANVGLGKPTITLLLTADGMVGFRQDLAFHEHVRRIRSQPIPDLDPPASDPSAA